MNDQLLAEIVAAYQAQDFKPIRRIFTLNAKGVDYVCPLVALAVHRGVVDRADPGIQIDGGANSALEWAAGQWGDDFVIGLLDGFDGTEPAKTTFDYLEGHELGVAAVDRLLIHEFGHEASGDHLSEEYHEALCLLGAKLKKLAIERPEAFRLTES